MPKRNPNAQGYKNMFENVKKEDDFLDISQITIFCKLTFIFAEII